MKRMGITSWQRELLSTLSQLKDGQRELTEEMREVKVDIRRLTEEMRDVKIDTHTMTRVIVRRFGTAGTGQPQVGDHVLFHVRPETVLPAVVIAFDADRLDLEVFGTDLATPNRFPRSVPQGTASGCWSFPT